MSFKQISVDSCKDNITWVRILNFCTSKHNRQIIFLLYYHRSTNVEILYVNRLGFNKLPLFMMTNNMHI